MNITYEKNGDYLIPNLISDPEPEGELRKFGLMRRHYLKEHRSGIYQAMLLSGKLKEHLFMMQEQAEAQFDLLVKQMAEQGYYNDDYTLQQKADFIESAFCWLYTNMHANTRPK